MEAGGGLGDGTARFWQLNAARPRSARWRGREEMVDCVGRI